MLYQRTKRNKNYFFNKKTIFIIIFFVLIFSINSFFVKSQNLLRFFARPVWILEKNISENFFSFLTYFKSKRELENQNKNLNNDNMRLNALILSTEALRKENEYLKKILGREDSRKMILASVLVKPNKSLYDTLIIDIGSDKGVLPGNIVFANGNIEIGVISTVYKKTSVVTLYSSPKYKSSVMYNENNMTIDLEGTGGGGFYFVVPRDIEITEGTVFTSLNITPYPVAISGKTISSQRDSFKKIIAQSPINIQQLRFVEVSVSY